LFARLGPALHLELSPRSARWVKAVNADLADWRSALAAGITTPHSRATLMHAEAAVLALSAYRPPEIPSAADLLGKMRAFASDARAAATAPGSRSAAVLRRELDEIS
jgi:hypothetical protein